MTNPLRKRINEGYDAMLQKAGDELFKSNPSLKGQLADTFRRVDVLIGDGTSPDDLADIILELVISKVLDLPEMQDEPLYPIGGRKMSSTQIDIYSSIAEDLDGFLRAWATPAYDAGFLLRQLPFQVRLRNRAIGYDVRYRPPVGEDVILVSSTPEDCLALLAIKLFEQNILKGKE